MASKVDPEASRPTFLARYVFGKTWKVTFKTPEVDPEGFQADPEALEVDPERLEMAPEAFPATFMGFWTSVEPAAALCGCPKVHESRGKRLRVDFQHLQVDFQPLRVDFPTLESNFPRLPEDFSGVVFYFLRVQLDF